MLESEPEVSVVGEVGDASQALSLLRRLQPHVLLLDEDVSGLDPVHFVQQLRRPPAVPTQVILMMDRAARAQEVVSSGIHSMLLKNSESEELVYAIRATAEFGAFLAPQVVCAVLELVDAADGRSPSPAIGMLTERERQVLCQVADGRSNAEIARELFVTEATIKYHVSHILQKLELRDRLQAAVFAHRSGLTKAPLG